jgi:hypothetical protein
MTLEHSTNPAAYRYVLADQKQVMSAASTRQQELCNCEQTVGHSVLFNSELSRQSFVGLQLALN